MSHQSHVRRVGSAYWISRAIILFVYAFAIACIVILAIAFFLQLFNANQTAPFVDWVYRAARRIMQPFRGIFPPSRANRDRSSTCRCCSPCSCTRSWRWGCMP